MFRRSIKYIILLTTFLILCNLIYCNKEKNIQHIISHPTNVILKQESEKIGKLIINKINLNQPLYKKESKKNNVDENVTILKESVEPSEENSIMFLAAHSGTGKIAYFENLDELHKNDEIILEYKNKTYYYQVDEIWEMKKTGTIIVPKKEKKQLILTTCSPTKENYQLIIDCTIKESN